MRQCCKCGGVPRNKTSSYCKSCHNEYQKTYYKNNPRSINESSKRRRKLIRDLVVSVKSVPCKDCGIKYPWYVMDFDHVKGKKKFVLSVAASKFRSITTVKAEIAKCEVVCANCHRERTFQRVIGR